MLEEIRALLAYAIALAAAGSFGWDLYDLVARGGHASVSEYIRSSWLRWPAGIAIGLLVAAHFCRWPWR